jgi:uncharacterized RDD family membrane protein YckC
VATYPPPPQTQPGATPGGASGPRAGFWARLAAVLIDGIIIGIVPGVLIIAGAASNSSGLIAIGWIIGVILGIFYEVYFHGKAPGQTIGKKALGIRVIDFNTGGSIGYGRAFLRLIGRYISGAICYLGYLWMLWDKEKQCWHDKMANDVVVPVSAYPVQ